MPPRLRFRVVDLATLATAFRADEPTPRRKINVQIKLPAARRKLAAHHHPRRRQTQGQLEKIGVSHPFPIPQADLGITKSNPLPTGFSEEPAKVDGAGYLRIFWSIVLPISPPILIVTAIWQFTGIWNEYLFGVTFSSGENQPITAALIGLSKTAGASADYGIQSAAVLLAALPTLLVYLFGGKYFVRGVTAGAVK